MPTPGDLLELALPLPPPAAAPDGAWLATWPLLAIHLVVGAWLVSLARILWPTTAAIGLALAAIALRLAVGEHVWMGADYPYDRYLHATGAVPPKPLYGATWNAVFGPLWWVSGAWPAFLWVGNAVVSGATTAVLHALVCRLHDARAATLAAALFAAMLLSVALAGTHTMFGLVALLQVCALLGLAEDGRGGDALAATSGVLLAHLRPLQGLFAVALMLELLRSRRRGAAGVLGLGLAWRGWELTGLTRAPGMDRILDDLARVDVLGPGGSWVATDPTVVPLGVSVLAVLGVRASPRAAAACLLTTLPYLHFERPTDVLRFQLPTMVWLAALAGPALLRHHRGWALVVLLTWWPARRPLGPRMPWQVEHAAMLQTPGTLHHARDASGFRAWARLRLGWRYAADAADGALLWRSRDGSAPSCARPEPVRVVALEPVPNDVEPVPVGIVGAYRCLSRDGARGP